MKEMELIDAVELRRKAETCIETTDAFIELIDSARVYIWCRKDDEEECPVMDLRPRVKGRWGDVFEHRGIKYHKCMACYTGIKVDADHQKYCPECGAEME